MGTACISLQAHFVALWVSGKCCSLALRAACQEPAWRTRALHPCRLDDAEPDPGFVCERVCTSQRLMRRMGSLAKERAAGA